MKTGRSTGTRACSGCDRQAASLNSLALSTPRRNARCAFAPSGVNPASAAQESSSTASPSV